LCKILNKFEDFFKSLILFANVALAR